MSLETTSQKSNLKSMPVEGFFSCVRTLARRLDNEVSHVGQEIERLPVHLNSADSDGTYAKHALQLARKEMKNLKFDVRNAREDLKRRSSTVIRASELFTALLDNYSERLESVEVFMEKYGYVRPDLQPEDESLVDISLTENPQAKEDLSSNESVTASRSDEERCQNFAAANENSTPPPCKAGQIFPSITRTPRLEDFGLSEYTLSLFSRNSKMLESATTSSTTCVPAFPDIVCKDTPDHFVQQQCSDNDTIFHTPVHSSLKQPLLSSKVETEMHTPQPEDFGLSSHMLHTGHKKIQGNVTVPFVLSKDVTSTTTMENLNNFQVSDSVYMTPEDVMLTQTDTTPKSEHLPTIYSFKKEESNKENFSLEHRSPKTPEMPNLFHKSNETPDSHSVSVKHHAESVSSSNTPANSTSSTPERPTIQTDELIGTDTDCAPQDVSLLPAAGQTPPLPVLSSKRYYNFD